MNTHKAQLYEELSINSHPALQTQLYDGWILRFANGYTNRANSINPLYPSSIDLEEKIRVCETLYHSQGLPAVYKLTDYTIPTLDQLLSEKDYTVITPTYVMDMSLQEKEFPLSDCIISGYADDEWLDCYFTFGRYKDYGKISAAKQILGNVKNTMLCVRGVKNGVSVACGSCVIERGYMSLLNIFVDESKRGNGYGYEICASLLASAKRLGAHTAYLQVVQDNVKALNLYAKLGYTTQYAYWYRVK